MKRKLLLMMASLLLAGTVSAQTTNFWENNPNSHAQPSNTPIVASVQIDGEAITATDAMRLGAFVGNELRGIAAKHTDGKFWIQVFYTAQTDNITFKFYDGETEYTTCETTLNGSDEGYGTPNAPQVLNFTATQTQTTVLADVWTWWSTPIEMNGVNGLQLLENSLGTNGIIIKGQSTSAVYLANLNRWVGSCPITNEASYSINISNTPYTIEISGIMANPEDHPITISNDWNWIGYPVNQVQTITTAFALNGFQPSAGDVVKGQSTSAVYLSPTLGWRPSNFTFTPGCGYMYKSAASSDKILTFGYANSRGTDVNPVADDLYWQANYTKSEGNITLLGVVYVDGEEQRSENLELGAFINGECRGSSRLLYIEPIDAYYVIMTISGEDGDFVDFELYNAEDGSINTQSNTRLVFATNDVIGEPENPYEVSFGNNSNAEMLKIYPNPVLRNHPFNLNIPREETVSQMTITNMLGNIVYSRVGTQTSHQSGISVSGVYFVKVICHSGKIYYGRIVVE